MLPRVCTALLVSAFYAGALSAAQPAVGSPAPEFGGTQFFNLPATMGSPVTLATLRGRVVLIDFWATWCGPCVATIPHLVELHDKYAEQGLVIIGHTDASSTDLEAFITSKKIPYLISVGPDIGDAYGVRSIPRVFLIDFEGNVVAEGRPQGVEGAIRIALRYLCPPPRFAQPASADKVARVEQSITLGLGKVGAGVKALEELAEDQDAASAAAAKASLETIAVWKDQIDGKITRQREAGDVYAAAELAASLAISYAGHDQAHAYQAQAEELRKDAGYAAGKEYQRLTAIPAEMRKDPRFAKMVEAFLKKFPEGYYADQARALK